MQIALYWITAICLASLAAAWFAVIWLRQMARRQRAMTDTIGIMRGCIADLQADVAQVEQCDAVRFDFRLPPVPETGAAAPVADPGHPRGE